MAVIILGPRSRAGLTIITRERELEISEKEGEKEERKKEKNLRQYAVFSCERCERESRVSGQE